MGKSNSKPDKTSIEQSGIVAGGRNTINETFIESVSIGEICGIVSATLVSIAVVVLGMRWCWRKLNKRIDQRVQREVSKSCELLAVNSS